MCCAAYGAVSSWGPRVSDLCLLIQSSDDPLPPVASAPICKSRGPNYCVPSRGACTGDPLECPGAPAARSRLIALATVAACSPFTPRRAEPPPPLRRQSSSEEEKRLDWIGPLKNFPAQEFNNTIEGPGPLTDKPTYDSAQPESRPSNQPTNQP
jgi:hypothetical protein